jgi:hypothetical protein
MLERGSHHNEEEQFERDTQESQRLVEVWSQAGEDIAEGINTSTEQLDTYLTAAVDYFHFNAQHAIDTVIPELGGREEAAIEYLKYKKILDGRYQYEKADYCEEQYKFHRGNAERTEQTIEQLKRDAKMDSFRHPAARERNEALVRKTEASIAQERRKAANWLRTQANCLEMPPPPPETEQQLNRE